MFAQEWICPMDSMLACSHRGWPMAAGLQPAQLALQAS